MLAVAEPALDALLRYGVLGVVVVLLIVGKFRHEREVLQAEAETSAWKAAYEIEVEARRHAERAAQHVIENGSVVMALVEALRTAKGEVS